ncbi:MAG: type II toxin-antitoxin system VapC family toxin [Deltaproteobacteria bacterium]|nr:type II toxin-antitoxin system VapC family toxin [Deltaproteobacteria bacterium]
MMKRLTIDSSVIISSLLENESRHGEAIQIWNSVITGGGVAVMPYSVFVEVVAAIRRRTGSEELANEVKEELLKIENVSFVILDQRAAEDAADIAIQKGVRGMDALVMQTAREYETELVTFDDEMMKKFQSP